MLNWIFKAIEIDDTRFFLDEFGNEVKQVDRCFTGTLFDADVEAVRRQTIFEDKFKRILKHVIIEPAS